MIYYLLYILLLIPNLFFLENPANAAASGFIAGTLFMIILTDIFLKDLPLTIS